MAETAPMPSGSAAGSDKPPESKNVFTELFGNEAAQKNRVFMAPPAAKQEAKTNLLAGAGVKSLKPMIAQHPGRSFFQITLLLLVLTVAGFLTQNSSRFSVIGVNPALRVEQAQGQAYELVAETRAQKHLAATLLLDQFSSLVDEYLYNRELANSTYSSENKKKEYEAKAEALYPKIQALLLEVQDLIQEDIPDEEVAAVKASVDTLVANLRAKEGQVDAQSLLQDVRDLETAKTLLQSASFKQALTGVNVEAVTDEELESLYTKFSSINSSVSALISKIKATRTQWSLYWDELETLTKTVDPLFNTEFAGSVYVSDIRFSSSGISVSGSTLTEDTKNFTVVSNLIDAYEESKWFQKVGDRSYVKTDGEENYSGNFKITMELKSKL